MGRFGATEMAWFGALLALASWARAASAIDPLDTASLPACDWSEETPAGLYLVTLAPGLEINSVFGHTQILDFDPRKGLKSRVYDFGYFDPSEPDFIWNFLTNQQDYQLRSGSLDRTLRIYGDRLGRQGVAQRLSVSPREERAVLRELHRLLDHRDGFFRYHWYESNCTTEVRDVLAEGLGPDFEAQQRRPSGASPRSEVLRHSAGNPLWFGLHWGSGHDADVEIDHWDRMFIPEALMTRAAVAEHRGRPLVESTCRLTEGPLGFADPDPPRRDLLLVGVGLGLSTLLLAVGWRFRRVGLALVAGWGVATGVFGSAALLVGVLGTFAPFWGHHNLLLASPLNLLLTVGAIGRWVSEQAAWPRRIAMLPLVAYCLAVVLAVFRLGGDHAVGLIGLFLCNAVAAALVARRSPTESG
jgi:hypothetical protein